MGLMEELGISTMSNKAVSEGISMVGSFLTYFGGALLFGVLIFLIIRILSFKHRFTHVQVVHGRKILIYDRARTYKDKDGVIFWKTLKTRELAPIPPPQAIELDKKGKKCVRCYRTQEGDFVYGIDSATVNEPPEELLTIPNAVERRAKIKEWHVLNPIIAAFQPFTSNHRSLFVNQIKKAKSRTTKSPLDQILQFAPLGMVLIFLLILVASWEDITAPAAAANGAAIELKQLELEQIKAIRDLKRDIQTIGSIPNIQKPPDVT